MELAIHWLNFIKTPIQKSPFDGSLVGQKSHPNRSNEFSIGKNFLLIPSAVGTWLGEAQKRLRKTQ